MKYMVATRRACGAPEAIISLCGAEKPAANLPEERKEPLVDGAEQIARSKRSPGTPGRRTDDALDELNVLETPLGELLLILQQGLGEKEQNGRSRAEV